MENLDSLAESVGIRFVDEDNGDAERSERSPSEASEFSGVVMEPMKSIAERKLIDMKHLEVESDIIRGLSLQKTLRSFGAVWMKSDPGQRQKCWEQAQKVKRFDVFLSHTWLTHGRWKFLSLLLQSSWPIFLLGWILGVLAAIPLHLIEDSPKVLSYTCTSFQYEGSCALRVYTHYFGMSGGILGLLLAPYIPSLHEKMCFLDVVSIHQADEVYMQRGIYAIGGFLAVSAELQILWDRPYFDRLWCVFELAAFRTCNPQGKISLTPLFVEAGLVFGLVVLYVWTTLHWLFPALGWPRELSSALHAVTILPFVHYCRGILHKKRQMIQALRGFDLTHVQCSSSFDRDFIQAGICKWYGSSEAFTDYVKGPLADELAEPFSRFRVPTPYWAVLAAPLISFEFCWILSLVQAGASVKEIAWMIWMRSSHVLLELTEIKFLVEACDHFAEPCNLNFVKTSCVWVGLVALISLVWQLHFFLEDAGVLPAFMSSLSTVVIFIIFNLGEVDVLPEMWKAWKARRAIRAPSES